MLQIITETHLIKQLITDAVTEAVSKITSSPPPTPEPEQRLTRKQAAEYLNCTLPTIDRYREQGRIPFYQTGRTIYFKRSEIDKALAVNPKRKAGRI